MGTERAGGRRFYGRDNASPGSLDLTAWPTAPPVVPSWRPPPAPPRARRWFPLLLVVALIASASGAAYWISQRRGPSYPKHWDPRVANLVSFVETERGLQFDHPVSVEFVPVQQFKKDVTTSDASLSAADRKEMRDVVSFLRALGLVEGKV